MEHVWLASQFSLSEKAAEQAGWIKINHGLLNETNILHFEPPTQKQLDTLFDWCQKHKVALPDWAGGGTVFEYNCPLAIAAREQESIWLREKFRKKS